MNNKLRFSKTQTPIFKIQTPIFKKTNYDFQKTNSDFQNNKVRFSKNKLRFSKKQTPIFKKQTPIFTIQTPIFKKQTPIKHKHRCPLRASVVLGHLKLTDLFSTVKDKCVSQVRLGCEEINMLKKVKSKRLKLSYIKQHLKSCVIMTNQCSFLSYCIDGLFL